MKRIVATIFILVYFVTNSGATLQLHYCMDKLVGWSLSDQGKSNCDKCGMVKKGHKGCCHDEHKIIKVGKDQRTAFTNFDFLKLHVPLSQKLFIANESVIVYNSVITYPTTHAPPAVKKVPLYLYNSVFRI